MSRTRSAGILLPISSLPSKYGIGTLGKEAYRFIDFLVKADQTYWQVLPIGPTSYGDSPYQSFSSFAGNPYFVDPDMLVEDGLLEKADLKPLNIKEERYVDYGHLYETRFKVLHKAYEKGKVLFSHEFEQFRRKNEKWLDDYALFMALKKHFDMAAWLSWPDADIRQRRPEAMHKYKEELKDDIGFYSFIQFLFYKQYRKLKDYADLNGIKIIGDLPIYVAMDSCDVWSDTKQFQLNENTKVPENVAGVPPDYFSKDGQLWGNPLYDWDYMKSTGYKWWIDRVAGVSEFFDVIRLDHFRGFHEYWAVPYGETTAKNGKWREGPSIGFISILRDWFSNVEFIAEDLGVISDDIIKMVKESTFPGMRVLEFGMEEDGSSCHCPHMQNENCVCYIATHDNVPIMGFLKEAKPKVLSYAKRYYGLNEEEGYNFGFIRGGMSSVSYLFICQMQDYLGLGKEATINAPGTLNNWKWRMLKGEANAKLAKKIALYTKTFGRSRTEKAGKTSVK
ncbi:MAG: 4-alpha-glucanotransferase [Erysipelotrichaceae bacterium]|nr:4-alpha-glucanotransferase [Erysipelotrichaceae bacterium]